MSATLRVINSNEMYITIQLTTDKLYVVEMPYAAIIISMLDK